jgi:glycosyltransferase involved in cell wall biosynthesis
VSESTYKILIDCTDLIANNYGGVRSYALSILANLPTQKNTIYTIYAREEMRDLIENCAVKNCEVTYFTPRGFPGLKFLQITTLALRMNYAHSLLKRFELRIPKIANGFDLIYVPTTYLNFAIKNANLLVTLHDIQEKDYPGNFPPVTRVYRNLRIKFTLKNVNTIHVSSQFVRNSLEKHYRNLINRLKFIVVPEGIDINKYSNSNLEKKKQILMPARAWKHKNHKILSDALLARNDNFLEQFAIVLVGASRDQLNAIDPILRDRIQILGFVSEEELVKLFQESFAVLSCSTYESSSLPLLEGCASHCLVVASDIPAHREMTWDLHFEFFDPINVNSLNIKLDLVSALFGTSEYNSIVSDNFNHVLSRDWTLITERILEGGRN